ncbi:MAG: shikimate kinase [Flavonifractor plautii]
MAFADTDERIERASGRTIPEIFASEGEEGFRARELDVSRALAREGGLVIACGGGLPTRAEAIAALKASGVVFWLSREPAVIYDTVSMARRPLGQGEKRRFWSGSASGSPSTAGGRTTSSRAIPRPPRRPGASRPFMKGSVRREVPDHQRPQPESAGEAGAGHLRGEQL